jgi:hypothetical protein
MGRADHLVLGDWNVQCFECGRKLKASHAERNWQGYYVHPEHNEPRQTQDFVRGVPDNQQPPWVQPWPAVIYEYINQTMGFGDGATVQFQLGDGLNPTTVTSVLVAGVSVSYTANTTGLCTLSVPPARYARVTGNGSEFAP